MTDTTTIDRPDKPVWVRCKGTTGRGNGCRQRVYNDPIDIEQHRQHCPADLKRDLKNLTKRLDDLEKTEIPQQRDLDDVGEDWPTDEDDQDAEAPDIVGARTPDDDRDDWDDDEDEGYEQDEDEDAPQSLYSPRPAQPIS